jgi:hypothetical protein
LVELALQHAHLAAAIKMTLRDVSNNGVKPLARRFTQLGEYAARHEEAGGMASSLVKRSQDRPTLRSDHFGQP